MKQIPWILIKKVNHSFLKKSCWKSSFSLKYHHHNFISACTVLSFRFLKSTLQVFVGWFYQTLFWYGCLSLFLTLKEGKVSTQDALLSLKSPGVAVKEHCVVLLFSLVPVKFFYFSFSLRFELKVSVLKNQTPEEEIKRACRPEKPSYASVRFCFPRPVAMLFFRQMILRPSWNPPLTELAGKVLAD